MGDQNQYSVHCVCFSAVLCHVVLILSLAIARHMAKNEWQWTQSIEKSKLVCTWEFAVFFTPRDGKSEHFLILTQDLKNSQHFWTFRLSAPTLTQQTLTKLAFLVKFTLKDCSQFYFHWMRKQSILSRLCDMCSLWVGFTSQWTPKPTW